MVVNYGSGSYPTPPTTSFPRKLDNKYSSPVLSRFSADPKIWITDSWLPGVPYLTLRPESLRPTSTVPALPSRIRKHRPAQKNADVGWIQLRSSRTGRAVRGPRCRDDENV